MVAAQNTKSMRLAPLTSSQQGPCCVSKSPHPAVNNASGYVEKYTTSKYDSTRYDTCTHRAPKRAKRTSWITRIDAAVGWPRSQTIAFNR